jgi:hypothetical protein
MYKIREKGIVNEGMQWGPGYNSLSKLIAVFT